MVCLRWHHTLQLALAPIIAPAGAVALSTPLAVAPAPVQIAGINNAIYIARRIADATQESFDSLDTTCKFLVMAINRSQVGGVVWCGVV